MGEYFLYANLDRREYFMIDAVGGATKRAGIGRNLGARALGLLLMQRREGADTNVIAGSWANQRVAVIGDSLPEFETARTSFKNLASAVALLLLEHEADELIAAAERDERLFVLLAELAHVHRVASAARVLAQRFGADWPKLYAKKRATSRVEVPPP